MSLAEYHHGVRVQELSDGSSSLKIVSTAKRMGAGVTALTDKYANSEDASNQLKSSLMLSGGSVAPEFAQIDALARSLGGRLPGTNADFIEMMTVLRRQGLSVKSILGGTGEAAALLGVHARRRAVVRGR